MRREANRDRIESCGGGRRLYRNAAVRAAVRAAVLALGLLPSAATGQTVHEIDRAASTPEERWQVRADPSLVVGRTDGSDEYILTSPLEAFTLSDGSVVIRDSIRNLFRLLYYLEDGTHLASASRFGQGPFELRYPVGVHPLPGDSAFVVGGDGRFAVFSPSAERVDEGRSEALMGVLPIRESRLIGPDAVALIAPRGDPPSEGTYRPDLLLLVWRRDGDRVDTLAFLSDTPVETRSGGEEGGVFAYPSPFAPETSVAGGADRIWVGQSERPEIIGFDSGGDTVAVLRFTDSPADVGRRDRLRSRRDLVENVDTDRKRRYARYGRLAPFPETLPHYARLEVDRAGRLWVKRYEVPWAEGPQLWDVLDPDGGRWLATAELPAALVSSCERSASRQLPCDRMLEVGEDHILVARPGPEGFPQVARYDIVRSGG